MSIPPLAGWISFASLNLSTLSTDYTTSYHFNNIIIHNVLPRKHIYPQLKTPSFLSKRRGFWLILTIFYSSCFGRIVGKRMISLMLWVSVKSIAKRSIPMPTPAAGGIPYSIASIKSSSLEFASLSPKTTNSS